MRVGPRDALHDEWPSRPKGPHRIPLVGVVNVTPDSFSDGGDFFDLGNACRQVDRLLEEGADVIEIGGESTRPSGTDYGAGFQPIDAKTQLSRVLEVVSHAVGRKVRVSIDTTLPEVAEACLARGASIINDVSCLADDAVARVAAAHDAYLVIMHARPGATSVYRDMLSEVAAEWCLARDRALAAGVDPGRIVMDPGIGFGKGAVDNLVILGAIPRFIALGHPVYLGPSRKSFIAEAEARSGSPKSGARDRLGGTIAACLAAVHAGASALRVHDVFPLRQALAVDVAIRHPFAETFTRSPSRAQPPTPTPTPTPRAEG
ncbi:MAG: dihydropteroate synthase [Polyangiales bacterium]